MTLLLIAAAGGHLTQLLHLRDRLPGFGQRRVWVTFETEQSRTALQGEEVVFTEYLQPRDIVGVARLARNARRTIDTVRPSIAISTGSSIAVAYLPIAAARGIPAHYIESATRVDGPSMSGRLLRRVPGIRLHCQNARWAGGRWNYPGSVFDGFSRVDREGHHGVRRLVVSVGTSEGYGFRAMIETLAAIVPDDVDVLWQTGSTDVSGLDIEARPYLPSPDLQESMAQADLVVTHAGTGSALVALDAGRHPVLVPRRSSRGEHIDDHQFEVANELERRGLATVLGVEELGWDALAAAAQFATTRVVGPKLRLEG